MTEHVLGTLPHDDAAAGEFRRLTQHDILDRRRDDAARVLELVDDGALAVGQHLGHHFVNAQLAGDGGRGAAVVAGDHRHLQAQSVQGGDGRRGARAARPVVGTGE